MKSILSFIFLCLTAPFLSIAQNAGNAFVSSNSYVSVPDNTNGSLDVANGHTIELWIKADDVQSDQKLFSKIGADFLEGYILGIENGMLKYEVFDDNNEREVLIAGSLTAGQWTHIAATFENGNKLILYVNGVKAGEETIPTATYGFNENPLRIGTSSWDPGALSFTGQIDELRYWQATLTEQAINDWALRYLDEMHPDFINLSLYHKYDEGSGLDAADASTDGNTGTLSSENWQESTAPFKAGELFVMSGPAIGGIWPGHPAYTLDHITFTGQGLSGDQSVVLESTENLTPGTICSYPLPAEIDFFSCVVWNALSQGSPSVSYSIDLSDYDLSGFESVVLLESTVLADFSGAKILEGSLNGNILEIPANTPAADNVYYGFGFIEMPSNINELIDNETNISISPNPTSGSFQLTIANESVEDYQLNILDYAGKAVYSKALGNISAAYQESFDLNYLPAGLYIVQLNSAKGMKTSKLIIQ